MKKRVLSFILVVVLYFSGIAIFPQPIKADDQLVSEEKTTNWNFSKHKILLNDSGSTRFFAESFAADTPKVVSFFDNSGCYDVVQRIDGESTELDYINIQRYDEFFNLLQTIKINYELPLFGNIICDGDFYYILWGQEDSAKQNGVVTILSKYSLEGNKIGDCKITGYQSNPYDFYGLSGDSYGTYLPFYVGTADMTIQNGVLACIYARKMYSGHQSNFCFYVDITTMERVNSNAVTYCSHSFDQAVIATSDGGYLYANHGDAYGRCFKIDCVDENRQTDYKCEPFHFREGANRDHGYNETYAQLGGIVENTNGYILCGSSEKTLSYDNAPTNKEYCGHSEARNLFVQVLKKDFYYYEGADQYVLDGELREAVGTRPESSYTDLFLPDGVRDYGVIWLTDYEDTYYVNNPKVVRLDDGNVAILWEKLSYDTHVGSTYFAIYDENMNVIQPATELSNVYLPGNTELSYKNGKIYWTTNDMYGQYINELDLDYKIPEFNKETAAITEFSLSLTEKIGLNCYIDLSQNIINDITTFLVVKCVSNEQTIPLSSLENISAGKYKLSYPVSAAKMNDNISVQIICRGKKLAEENVSVKKYTDYILQHQNDNIDYKKAVPVVKAMLNYGGYAQQYFKYNISNPVNKGLYTTVNDPVLNNKINSTMINDYDYANLSRHFYTMYETNFLKYYGESLICDDAIAFNLYFNIKDKTLSFDKIKSNIHVSINKYNNGSFDNAAEYNISEKDGMICTRIENIPVQNMDDIFTCYMWYSDEQNTIFLPCSPMEYIFKAMNSDNTKLANLSKAIYWYWDAAKTYTM